MNFPAASGSAWRLRGRWLIRHLSFWRTSRPGIWIQKRATRLWRYSRIYIIREIRSSWLPTNTTSRNTRTASFSSATERSLPTRSLRSNLSAFGITHSLRDCADSLAVAPQTRQCGSFLGLGEVYLAVAVGGSRESDWVPLPRGFAVSAHSKGLKAQFACN